LARHDDPSAQSSDPTAPVQPCSLTLAGVTLVNVSKSGNANAPMTRASTS
jgi:hypothetical protein